MLVKRRHVIVLKFVHALSQTYPLCCFTETPFVSVLAQIELRNRLAKCTFSMNPSVAICMAILLIVNESILFTLNSQNPIVSQG